MIEQITINKQSSIRIQGEKVIYFDPYEITEETHDADVIFITHDHPDHFQPASIEKILRDDTLLVIPRSSFGAWSNSGIIATQVVQMDPGQAMDLGGLQIETVPAYNHLKPFHPRKQNWLGYVITFEGRRIYVTGDTDATDEARAVHCDIMFVPVGGKFTMNVAKAAELVNAVQPDIAVPTHYGGGVGKTTDGAAFRKAVHPGIHVALLLHYQDPPEVQEETMQEESTEEQ